jgi:hypothetical protein
MNFTIDKIRLAEKKMTVMGLLKNENFSVNDQINTYTFLYSGSDLILSFKERRKLIALAK